mmetsp:Transcript_6584/g.27203  ORF Transcript_6584/g.27203 Transcript_6584/m.27203 type:complete len:416 (-) Transcript_6584:1490-2737(-)
MKASTHCSGSRVVRRSAARWPLSTSRRCTGGGGAAAVDVTTPGPRGDTLPAVPTTTAPSRTAATAAGASLLSTQRSSTSNCTAGGAAASRAGSSRQVSSKTRRFMGASLVRYRPEPLGQKPGSEQVDRQTGQHQGRGDQLPGRQRLAEQQAGRAHAEHRHQQRHGHDAPGRVAGQQPAPGAVAEQGIAQRLPEHRRPDAGVGGGQAGGDVCRPVDQQGQQQQRRHREGAAPDHIGQHVDAAGALGQQVGAGPAEGRREHHRDAQHRRRAGDMRRNDANAAGGEPQAQPLRRQHLLLAQAHRQQEGEEDLGLHDQRGQAGRNLAAHGQVQQAELAHADQHAIAGQVAPAHLRPAQQEAGRQQCEGEAQHGQQQRRQRVQREFDDDEIAAPDRDDGKREKAVAKRQGHEERASGWGA